MSYMITEATDADCAALGELATRTFVETFGHLYTPEDLSAHLAETRSADYFARALESGETVLKLMLGNTLVGYGQIGRVCVPVQHPPEGSQEITRLYIAAEHQNKGYGKALLMHMLSLPRAQASPAIYLSVYEENVRAQNLYLLHDFKKIGTYLYYVGKHADREIIMARVR